MGYIFSDWMAKNIWLRSDHNSQFGKEYSNFLNPSIQGRSLVVPPPQNNSKEIKPYSKVRNSQIIQFLPKSTLSRRHDLTTAQLGQVIINTRRLHCWEGFPTTTNRHLTKGHGRKGKAKWNQFLLKMLPIQSKIFSTVPWCWHSVPADIKNVYWYHPKNTWM